MSMARKLILLLKQTKTLTKTRLMNSPIIHMRKMKLKTNKVYWPSGTCTIVRDSIINGIDEKHHKKYGNLKFFISRVQELKILIIIS